MGIASLLLLPNVFPFFAHGCLVIKNKMVVSIEAFSPSLLVNYKSMGGSRFGNVL